MLHGLGGRLHDLTFDLVEDLADDQAGGLGGARGTELGQTQGEGCGGLCRDELGGQHDELDDDGDFSGENGEGGGIEGDGDHLGRRGGVTKVVVAAVPAAGKGTPFVGKALDRLSGVGGDDLTGCRRALGGRLIDRLGEVAPGLGALVELVLVGIRPVVAEQIQDPSNLAWQRQ